jgi:CRISPR-associated protein Csm3
MEDEIKLTNKASNTMTKLTKKILIKGEVHALSGLLIGGSNSAMGIGGPDKVVIRNPISNEPYIPGSSLKGKMRSLLELSYGFISNVNMGRVTNGPDNNINNITALLFGTANNDVNRQRPSRIIVRDGSLLNADELINTELPFTETKTEVVIDRITSAAMPRTFERVPAGAKFKLDIVLNIFDIDNKEKDIIKHTFKALQLVQDDYLGGSGSRGSGNVKFFIKNVLERDSNYYQSGNLDTGKDITDSCDIPKELR